VAAFCQPLLLRPLEGCKEFTAKECARGEDQGCSVDVATAAGTDGAFAKLFLISAF